MKLIQPICRVQFTAEDIDFILRVLGRAEHDKESLIQLLTDPDTRDLILDDPTIHAALLEFRGCLSVSNHFYFYIMVRNVLNKAGLDDRSVADYVAELLSEYSQFERTRCRLPGQTHPLDYFFEMLAALQTADERTAFFLRAHIGNHSLFLSGVFPQRIKHRAESRGFPDVRYYEALGRANFGIASDHRLAARYELGPIFATLSERFDSARHALNDLSERVLNLGDSDPRLDAMLLKSAGACGKN